MSAPRLLVVKLSSLGDLVHAVPAADALRRHLGARMDWVTQPEYLDLVRCLEGVEQVIAFPRRHFLRGAPALRRALRAARYDLVVDLQGLLKSAAAAWLSGAPRRVAPSFAREGSAWLHTERAAPGGGVHAVERCLDSARHLGAPAEPPRFPFRFPAVPEPLRREDRRPRLALAPRSRWPAKDWPAARFAALARHAVREWNAEVFVLGGTADAEVAGRIEAQAGVPLRALCGKLDLASLGGFFAELDLLVTNDSGPMHLAAAAGTRVVALFGPTDPARTGPWGAHCTVLRPEDPTLPSPALSAYKSGDRRWMEAISEARVTAAVAQALHAPA
jgi:lipopolysaccharide heptosyltransferase I